MTSTPTLSQGDDSRREARKGTVGSAMTILAATLFSGIGAPEVAMPHWRWLWHAEIEKFPSAVMVAPLFTEGVSA